MFAYRRVVATVDRRPLASARLMAMEGDAHEETAAIAPTARAVTDSRLEMDDDDGSRSQAG